MTPARVAEVVQRIIANLEPYKQYTTAEFYMLGGVEYATAKCSGKRLAIQQGVKKALGKKLRAEFVGQKGGGNILLYTFDPDQKKEKDIAKIAAELVQVWPRFATIRQEWQDYACKPNVGKVVCGELLGEIERTQCLKPRQKADARRVLESGMEVAR